MISGKSRTLDHPLSSFVFSPRDILRKSHASGTFNASQGTMFQRVKRSRQNCTACHKCTHSACMVFTQWQNEYTRAMPEWSTTSEFVMLVGRMQMGADTLVD